MILETFNKNVRDCKSVTINTDFVIVGGGTAGVCAAITAARKGTKTILVQDRPVLGGNASSEVRLWILGATSHMGNNNRWAREGGVMDEILVENLYRNREGNAVIFDTVLLEKVLAEPNITLLLNTSVYDITKSGDHKIESVKAFNSQNSTEYNINAPLFCDASGDGIVAFKAGAAFRMGAETKEEFGEAFAPEKSYGELLGHSMYFYSKKTEKPVKYIPPAYALKDITTIPRYKAIGKDDKGCRFWWFEYGGRHDTIHETEEIKYELWKVIYGVWDYIKNSGTFEGVENMTLEWVATVPGKRESRRFEGLYMMTQQDIIEQRKFDDAIAFGGWAIDLHPADGVYSELSGCTQWHSKGIYDIPYRSFVSKDIDNLFLAGRIISATHVAFGSTRVMATTGFCAQAVGMAASMCIDKNLKPAEILENGGIKILQNELNKIGQSIPNVPILSTSNLVNQAKLTSSSTLSISEIPFNGNWFNLSISAAQMLPLEANKNYKVRVLVKAEEKTDLKVELRTSIKPENYTPEVILESQLFNLEQGEHYIDVEFSNTLESNQYGFITFLSNDKVSIKTSDNRFTGVLSVFNGVNKAVSNNGKQTPPDNIGVDTFEFWTPHRRPEGKNIAMEISPAIEAFEVENLSNGFVRPGKTVNAWGADINDEKPTLKFEWDSEQELSQIKLFLDSDYDHPMESTLMGHPEDIVPFCLGNYKIKDVNGTVLFEKEDNHQTINTWQFKQKHKTKGIIIETEKSQAHVPVSIFEILIS
ncbi:hypothetical protein JCM19274_1251 [Algibacter lectus]|uniref:Fumarate reductase flavoprotein subunit n=1 Tax=Algibacter lectus TaxID=221126 RepID=A0A090WU29_9FLAO|nr:FAD-dependent oxidoreductase [Algibacter lectus]GAL80625.1 hypothetical protein JCM19274_1251 [Algibacter lectus]